MGNHSKEEKEMLQNILAKYHLWRSKRLLSDKLRDRAKGHIKKAEKIVKYLEDLKEIEGLK